jgi:predicted membrane-bound spermidine synthase
MVFLPNLGVNLRACLCGVVNYASAQALDFLDLGQKSAFLDRKHHKRPSLITAICGWALTKIIELRLFRILP